MIVGIDMRLIEPNMLIAKQQKVFVPHWDKQLDGFKICVITDLHLGEKTINLKKLTKVVQKVNSQKPDLIVMLGDLDASSIVESNYATDDIAEILKNLHAKYGVISILGNHDYYPKWVVKEALYKSNIQVLEDESLLVNDQKIRVVGFRDLWHDCANPTTIIDNKQSGVPIIVLTHNPDLFAKIPNNVSLTLGGHTHGGEIILPFVGSPFIPSRFGQRYRKGYVVENNRHLYVSSGVASHCHMRLLNLPEIVVLKVYSQDEKNKIINTKRMRGFKKNYASLFLKN